MLKITAPLESGALDVPPQVLLMEEILYPESGVTVRGKTLPIPNLYVGATGMPDGGRIVPPGPALAVSIGLNPNRTEQLAVIGPMV